MITGYKIMPSLKTSFITGAAMAVMLVAQAAHAQVENATGIADPSRAAQQFIDDVQLPKLTSKVEVESSAALSAPAGAENIVFKLEQIQIDGVNAYSAAEIDSIYRDYLGKTVNLADVYTIANDLTRKYRNDGFILTQVIVPPQTIDGGIVTLRAVEGFVDQVNIQGDVKGSESSQIMKYANNMKKDNILDTAQMERSLLLINDLPGVKARSVLSPSATTPGASDLSVIVERDPYEAQVEFNNHGSRYLGPYQGIYTGALNSMLGFNEQIRTQFVVSGDKDRLGELLFGTLSYEQPINRHGTTVRFMGSFSETEPGYDLDPFNVEGKSRYLSATLSHPFIRSRTQNLFGRVGFDLRNVRSENNLEAVDRKDNIRALRLGASYQVIDTLVGIGANNFDLQFSRGLDVLGASGEDDARLTRARGEPEFTKLEFTAERLQRVTSNVNVLVAAAGQWSATPLLSSEEFGVGGMNIGRGYDSSEIVGDDGVSGKIELQWNAPRKVEFLHDYQIFAYVDAGRVWDQDATTSSGKRDSLVSVGLGARADITEQTTASVGVGLPLTRERDSSNDKDPRFYFSVSHKF